MPFMWIHTPYEFILIMWSHTLCEFILIMWIHTSYESILCWRNSLFLGAILSLCLWSKCRKNTIALVRAMVMPVIIILRIQTPAFWRCAWLVIMLFNMMIFVASAAWARARARSRARGRLRSTPFFRTNCRHSTKRTGHCSWPRHSFSWSDRGCDHPSCCKTCCSSCPYCRVNHNHGINRLDDDNLVGNHRGRVGCFDDGRGSCNCNAGGSLTHGYVQ